MEHLFVSFFESHLTLFKHFGYIILFLIALTESIPLLGMLIPGQTIIILAGFMVKLHFFGFWASVITSTLGALGGDVIGFAMGRKWGHHFTTAERKFYIKREQFEKTKHLIAHNPFNSIFFGRLHSLTRTLTPFAAGASHITLRKFASIDIIASFVWALLSILIGYIFGKSFEKASAFIGSFILIATVITVCIMFAVSFARKRNIKISGMNVFLFITSVTSVYLFALIADDLERGRLFTLLDTRLYMLRYFVMTPDLTLIMTMFTTLGNPLPMTLLALTLVFYLVAYKRYSYATLVASVLGSGTALVELLKIHFARIRPIGIIDVSGGSFPSWHMSMSIMLAVVAIYTVFRFIKSPLRKNIYIAGSFILSLLIGLSRVYLGVHWASDVLAGLLFGIAWATCGILSFEGIQYLAKTGKKKHAIPLP